ncbi:MAG: GNAT family N-acetyltransferase [Thermotaleaceae bacterium]
MINCCPVWAAIHNIMAFIEGKNSTFLGKPGIYLEDIYIQPIYRGRGFGKLIFAFLARLAEERNCWGLEWTCLNWNEPSIHFYESIGAVHREGWMIYRLKDKALNDLASDIGAK